MIYIASPFFNPEEIAFIQRIEQELDSYNVEYFSPRHSGTLQDMSEEEKQKSKAKIYKENIDNIRLCDIMVAVIDGRDTGTIWEMGYATALGKDIISISNYNYGLNVMLAKSVRIHIVDIDLLVEVVKNPSISSPSTNNVF